jgi:CRISPR-associated protein Csd2
MKHNDPKRRHDFLYLFEVTNGNPNGDPDAGNMPRMDPETNLGIVTDVAIKRKVRDFVTMSLKGAEGKKVFIQSASALNSLMKEAAEEKSIKGDKKKANLDLQKEMCRRYYDIRMFGAVLSTGDFNAGQVRGPMQVTFARSQDPIVPMDLSITRQAATKESDIDDKGGKTMGRKPVIPYGLYMAKGHYNPFLGAQTGADEDDLKTFWLALEKMFEFDRSAARGEMAARGLWVFTHDTELGNHPTHKLFDLVQIKKRASVEAPRAYTDYEETVGNAPDGVTLTRLI